MMIYYNFKRPRRQQCNLFNHQYQYWFCPVCKLVFAVYCPQCEKFVLLKSGETILVTGAGLMCVDCAVNSEFLRGYEEG